MVEEKWESSVWEMIYGQGKIEEAVKYLDRVLAENPQNDTAHAIKANALNQLADDTKNWDHTTEALKCADKAIGINSRNDVALFNKAWSLVDLGRPREALEYADKAVGVDPQNAYAWYNKAWAHHMLHQIEKALECCGRMIEIDPSFTDWAEAMKNRIKKGEFPEHLAKFRK